MHILLADKLASYSSFFKKPNGSAAAPAKQAKLAFSTKTNPKDDKENESDEDVKDDVKEEVKSEIEPEVKQENGESKEDVKKKIKRGTERPDPYIQYIMLKCTGRNQETFAVARAESRNGLQGQEGRQ